MESQETAALSAKTKIRNFFEGVVEGLKAKPKFLSSKYFYDQTGDKLFQQIMHCPDYYLTDCEHEILSEQSEKIASVLHDEAGSFDVVGLGPGDASKSVYLLKELLKTDPGYTYFPVDISENVISMLKKDLPQKLPQLRVNGLNGEYFDMLEKVNRLSDRKKVVLFLGSNIGNFFPPSAQHFCRQMQQYLQPGNLLLTGIDLKKHPQTILNAYNDKQGFTKAFNLNLLQRINRELHADFEISQFDHYPTYDPATGACKSYLISRSKQQVHIQRETITFEENDTIFMEISQKYSPEETDRLAIQSGFKPLYKFFDRKKWFVDCIWRVMEPD